MTHLVGKLKSGKQTLPTDIIDSNGDHCLNGTANIRRSEHGNSPWRYWQTVRFDKKACFKYVHVYMCVCLCLDICVSRVSIKIL